MGRDLPLRSVSRSPTIALEEPTQREEISLPMQRPDSAAKTPRFIILAAVCVVVAALYFAQDVLIPLALAIMLTFLLAPLVQRMERWRLPRPAAVLIAVSIVFGGLCILAYVVATQVYDLAKNIDQYKHNIVVKVDALRPGRGGVFEKLRKTASEVQENLEHPEAATTQSTQPTDRPAKVIADEIATRTGQPRTVTEKPKASAGVATTQWTKDNPLPVAMVEPTPSPIQTLSRYLGLALGPLGTAGIVIVFVFFMLLTREDMRNRMIRLIGYGQLTVTTQALDDAAQRISRYLIAQAIVNGTYGIAISIGLWIIGRTFGRSDPGFPNVVLWGLLCALLRFIPYIGPWIGAAFPMVLSLAVYEGFSVFVATVAMFVVIELLSNNLMEPLLYGSSTGMSTMAILVSAVFWTWLWGPIGLLLATPLTVCLVVLGKYVPQLQFLDILLGDEPVLEPHERLYQRWLALDQEEAAELVGEFFQTRSLEDMYDSVLLPALALAEQDRHNGRLDERRQQFIRQSMRQLIDELGDEYRVRFARSGESTSQAPGGAATAAAGASDAATPRIALQASCTVNVVVLPAHDEADEIVGLMFAQVLEFNNYCATPAAHQQLAGEMLDLVERRKADCVCVSALPPAAVTHSRYLCKRLHQRYPQMKMVVGLWSFKGDLNRAKERITCEGAVQIVTRLAAAIDQVEQLSKATVVQQLEANKAAEPAVK